MQGNAVHQGILNDLSVSHAFLVNIFPSFFARKRPTLVSILENIKSDVRTKTEKTSEEVISALRSCIVHNAEISTWFGGALGGINADKIVANVLRFKKEGHFIGRTPKAFGGSGLDLGCGEKSSENYFRIDGVRLQEQVRAAVFVCGDVDSANSNGLTVEQHSALRDFIIGHETASQIVSLINVI